MKETCLQVVLPSFINFFALNHKLWCPQMGSCVSRNDSRTMKWDNTTEARYWEISVLLHCKNIDTFIPMLIFTNLDTNHGSAHFSAPHHCHLNLSSHPLSLHLFLGRTPLGYKLPSLCLNCTTDFASVPAVWDVGWLWELLGHSASFKN